MCFRSFTTLQNLRSFHSHKTNEKQYIEARLHSTVLISRLIFTNMTVNTCKYKGYFQYFNRIFTQITEKQRKLLIVYIQYLSICAK